MQDNPLSHGLWEMTAPPAPPTSPLKGEVRADVAVVGCGYTGLSAALHLAEAGAKVVALEAVEIGFGGAGRNVGLVNAGMWLEPRRDREDARSRIMANGCLSLLGGGPAEVLQAHRQRTPSTASRCATARCIARSGRAGARRDRGARAAMGRARRARPGADQPQRRRRGSAPTFTPARSSTCAPEPSSRSPTRAALRRAAIAAGAAIHTQSPVRSAERTGKVWTLTTDGGTVAADWIAVATDAYGGAPWPQGRREQIRAALFQFRHPPAERRACRLRSCLDARAAGTPGSS